MSITATQLKENLGMYLLMAEKEDIFISKNGRIIAKLTSPYKKKQEILKSLKGCIKSNLTFEELREERLSKI